MKKISILQSNYIPWKGVFDMIDRVDKFVFFEDVDFTKRDWRTRNYIKTANGLTMLTVPVKKTARGTKINNIYIVDDDKWRDRHINIITTAYSKARHFQEYRWILDEIYRSKKITKLSDFNMYVTKLLCNVLNIEADFVNSTDLATSGRKDDKLIEICKCLGATHYLSGPSAKSYISAEKFDEAELKVEYMEYVYPEYPQMFGDFEHGVSVLDLIFNCAYAYS